MSESVMSGYLEICKRFTGEAPDEAIIKEPYLPYVPRDWNGLLVLAEAQNLADDNYVSKLRAENRPEELMDRLNLLSKDIWHVDIEPWRNLTIPLALKSMKHELDLTRVAVSNAVPWSIAAGKRNLNPTPKMMEKSVLFWKELFSRWHPKAIITCGKIAREVMHLAEAPILLELRLPSPNNINRICRMFDREDLLNRYSEVREAAEDLKRERNMELKFNDGQIFFACHAVSLGKKFASVLAPAA